MIRSWLPRAALAVAAVIVLVLVQQNRALREESRDWRRRALFPYPGFVVPAFRAATLAGDSVTIGESREGTRQVLFFFNTTCRFCLETLPGWKEVDSELVRSGGASEVFGVSLDSLPETRRYASEHELPFPIIRLPDPRFAKFYRAEGIPLTLILDREGTVLHSRVGSIEPGPAVDSIIAAARRIDSEGNR